MNRRAFIAMLAGASAYRRLKRAADLKHFIAEFETLKSRIRELDVKIGELNQQYYAVLHEHDQYGDWKTYLPCRKYIPGAISREQYVREFWGPIIEANE
jgi:hypothetical protein